jgi:hypothetical protein
MSGMRPGLRFGYRHGGSDNQINDVDGLARWSGDQRLTGQLSYSYRLGFFFCLPFWLLIFPFCFSTLFKDLSEPG